MVAVSRRDVVFWSVNSGSRPSAAFRWLVVFWITLGLAGEYPAKKDFWNEIGNEIIEKTKKGRERQVVKLFVSWDHSFVVTNVTDSLH